MTELSLSLKGYPSNTKAESLALTHGPKELSSPGMGEDQDDGDYD